MSTVNIYHHYPIVHHYPTVTISYSNLLVIKSFFSGRQDSRKVLWVWEATGSVGKSWLAKWLIVNRDAFYIQNGKNADIAYAYSNEEYVVMDLTRSQENMLNYGMIESFKNGVFFSPKYNSTTKIFKPVKMVIFANWQPDKEKLSEDRWDIHHVATPSAQRVPPIDMLM